MCLGWDSDRSIDIEHIPSIPKNVWDFVSEKSVSGEKSDRAITFFVIGALNLKKCDQYAK